MGVIEKICLALDCKIKDVVEIIPDGFGSGTINTEK